MKFKTCILATSLGLAFAGTALADTVVITDPKAVQTTESADSSRSHTSETTTTTTTTAPAIATPVTEASVATILMNAGYHDVHDIELKKHKGVWKAKADNVSGDDMDIQVDATTGRIVHVEED